MTLQNAAKRFYAGAFNALHDTSSALGFGMASYRQPQRLGDMAMIRRIKRQRDMLLTPLEAVQLVYLVRATAKLGGCMAEVGVYRGASARLMREGDKKRPFHLFDTFTGLPETSQKDTAHRFGQFGKGQFACGLEDVQRYLSDVPGLHFHPGLFPETGAELSDEQFSFVHIDVDIYDSSIKSLEWFYGRMLPGGIIVSHDFASAAGPRAAFTEFFEHRPEPLIELPGDQCMIVKV